ncbi:MAG: tetratricopeptide repeat protein [Bacteroidetes bacterium]|nr:tetratricopeptide repeat protein [Bacteroidota bacterium]
MRIAFFSFLLFFPIIVNAQEKDRLHRNLVLIKTNIEDTTRAVALNDIGWDTSYENLAVGLKYCEEALELSRKINFPKGMILAYNSLGTIYEDMGEYNKAIDSHNRCLQIADSIGNRYNQATSWMNLSLVYKTLREKKKAYDCASRSLSIYLELKSKRGLAVVYNNLGSIYLDIDSLDKAIDAFTTSLRYARELKRPDYEAHALSGLSSVYIQKGDSVRSEMLINRCIAILDSMQDDYDKAQAIYDHGYLLFRFHHYKDAETKYMEAMDLFRMIGMTEQEKETWLSLSDLYEAMNDPQRSLDALKKYDAMKDSLLNEKVLRHQRELEALYDSERSASRIRQLEADGKLTNTYVTALVAGVFLLLIILFILYNRNKLRRKTNDQLTEKNAIIGEKNKNITDSITYARRIQEAVLPDPDLLLKNFSDSFIFYLPRDIVSGDFWWFTENEGKFFLAVADCTGHGVPGGFMSVMGAAFLSEIIVEKKVTDPGGILNALRDKVIRALHHEGDENKSVRDGMDMVMCIFNSDKTKVDFACANNPLWLVRDGKLTAFETDNFPVGVHEGEMKSFRSHSVSLCKNDMLYMFTDGFADQFGGKDGKKYKYRQMKELVVHLSEMNGKEQHEKIETEFHDWKNELEQVDDVLVVGIRI